MYKVTICIPTYRRPAMLKALIESIAKCRFDGALIETVTMVVVDNDVDRTAESVIREWHVQVNEICPIHYYHFPAKGITNVRNELIRKAGLYNPDFIVFIDDDEYVTSEWLNELVKTILNNNSDAARGPVLAVMEKPISRSISYWFKRESYPDNSQIYSLTTGNLILKFSSIQEYDVWFDSRFNIIGSSDTFFGNQILKKGAKIYWSANAIAYETIPEKRANLKWLIKRIYRLSSTYTYVMKLEKGYARLFKKIIVSLVYILLGGSALISILFPIKKRYWAILTLTEGIGGLAGLVSILYKEYK